MQHYKHLRRDWTYGSLCEWEHAAWLRSQRSAGIMQHHKLWQWIAVTAGWPRGWPRCDCSDCYNKCMPWYVYILNSYISTVAILCLLQYSLTHHTHTHTHNESLYPHLLVRYLLMVTDIVRMRWKRGLWSSQWVSIIMSVKRWAWVGMCEQHWTARHNTMCPCWWRDEWWRGHHSICCDAL